MKHKKYVASILQSPPNESMVMACNEEEKAMVIDGVAAEERTCWYWNGKRDDVMAGDMVK